MLTPSKIDAVKTGQPHDFLANTKLRIFLGFQPGYLLVGVGDAKGREAAMRGAVRRGDRHIVSTFKQFDSKFEF